MAEERMVIVNFYAPAEVIQAYREKAKAQSIPYSTLMREQLIKGLSDNDDWDAEEDSVALPREVELVRKVKTLAANLEEAERKLRDAEKKMRDAEKKLRSTEVNASRAIGYLLAITGGVTL